MKDRIDIIGAGIGGLTTALILHKRGYPVNIFEGAEALKPVGAGILIASNAMQVFEKMGIRDQVENAGHRVSSMKITDTQFRNISVTDLTAFERKYGVCNVAIHRGDLQNILARQLGHQYIQLSKRLVQIERSSGFQLTFEDHTTIESAIVIGADGLKSRVRNQVFRESTLRNAKQTCWRGFCELELPSKYNHGTLEAWGRGKRFGFVKMNNRQVYWYAVVNSNSVSGKEVSLSERFREFHQEILNIINATSPEQIIRNDIMDLMPIDLWHKEKVCLIGDAAHACTPNLGQGACQAIEDAYVIGQLIDKGMDLDQVFENYERLRRKKALWVVNTSWQIGKMAHWTNPFLVGLRNLILRSTPASVHAKQMEKIFQLNDC